jgi:beta-mannosidase
VNDRPEAVTITVTANAAAMDGTTRKLGKATVTVSPDAAVPVLTVAPDALRADEVLAFTWSGDAQGGDVHAPKPWKAYDLAALGPDGGHHARRRCLEIDIAGQGTRPVCCSGI